MAARFWVGGTGNWDAADTTHWAATSGGAGGQTVPGASDTVTLDASSGGGTVTITATQTVSSITSGAHTGTLDFNGQTVNASFWDLGGTGTRTVTLGSSTINLSFAGNALRCTVTTGLTMTANTAVVNITGAGGLFQCTTFNFNGISLVFSGSGAQGTNGSAGSSPTVLNLTRTGTAAKTDSLSIVGDITCTGTFTVNGNSAINRVLVTSSSTGTARTITAATVSITNADFQDITGAGAGSWDLSAITGNSGDCGGNSGITFTTAETQTATGTSSFTWSTHGWTSRVPLPQDNVSIPNAFSASQTVTMDMPRIGKDVTFTCTGSPAWSIGLNCSIYGSLTLASGISVSGLATISYSGRGTHTITTAGASIPHLSSFVAFGGSYTLQDAYTTTNSLTVTNGKFDANNFNVTFIGNVSFSISGTALREVVMGSGTWTLTGTTNLFVATTTTNLTFSGASSTIVVSGASATARTFVGGGLTHGTLQYTTAGSTGKLTITGSNSFSAIQFSDVTNARTLEFTAGTTTTIRSASGWQVNGTSGKLMTVTSSSAATHTISCASGTISSDYLNVSYSIGSGGARFFAGANSTDSLNNTGWYFAAPSNGLGGTVTTDGAYTVHTFTSDGTFTATKAMNIDWFMVAGGGGGGGPSGRGGGGGAGGYKAGTNYPVTVQTYSIVVGAGGAGSTSSGAVGTSGGNSTFDSNTATGGGGGGTGPAGASRNGANGGSGGGAGDYAGSGTAGTGTAGQGFDGGIGMEAAPSYGAGGGGGAGAVGQAGSSSKGGDGGAGISSSISGSAVTYAGGGGGAAADAGATYGVGGTGGGGRGASNSAPVAGTANTGGGGGGGNDTGPFNGANGGSGIFILRYLTTESTGVSNGYHISRTRGTAYSNHSAVAYASNRTPQHRSNTRNQ